jgi:predicted RNA polymerase sigma factor
LQRISRAKRTLAGPPARRLENPGDLAAVLRVLYPIYTLHDDASTEETDWPQILAWYDDLVELTDEPVRQDPAAVRGRAVAVAHVLGPAAGLRETTGCAT